MSRDLDKEISCAHTVLPLIRTTAVASTSATAVDLAGYRKAAFVATIGTVTDGTFSFDPEHSDDGSSWSDIPAAQLSGAFTNVTSANDDTVQEVGYLGEKRYLRCGIGVSGGPSTGGTIGVLVVRAGASREPV